jgi:hypothetical protein
MLEVESHDNSSEEVGFDDDAFIELAQAVLTELRCEVLKRQNSHNLVEQWMQDTWKPSIKNHLLSALFDKFPELRDEFDITTSAKKLYTLENLEELVSENGVNTVAQRFLEYFARRMYKWWHVLIEVENLEFGADFPELGTENGSVVLRQLKEDERELFHKIPMPKDRLNSLFFIAVPQAGDALKAVEKARANIQRFLVPYYLHRMRNPDGWWRARTQRNILSPVSFYVSENETGVLRELKQLKGRAKDLFFPDSPMDEQWKKAVQSLSFDWNNYGTDSSKLGSRLRLCSRWMFAAETEEDTENAFLKHCVAWEALLPKEITHLRRSWYLLLLCAGSYDPLCIKTVSQGERLIDRRNSFAHPENKGGLRDNVEQDLDVLKESLFYAFDFTLQYWERVRRMGDTTYEWGKLLAHTFDMFTAKSLVSGGDSVVRTFLSDLGLVSSTSSRKLLDEAGYLVRAEALCVKSRECWKDDRQGGVKHLARSYHVASQHPCPCIRLHMALWLKKRIAEMPEQELKKAWLASDVTPPVPSVTELESLIEGIYGHGIRPEHVGWKGSWEKMGSHLDS